MIVDRISRIAAWGIVLGATIVLAFRLLSVVRMLAFAFNDPRAGGWSLRLIFLLEVPTVAFPVLVVLGGVFLSRSLRVSKWLFVAALCVWFVVYGVRTLGIRVQTYHFSASLEFMDICMLVLPVAGLLIVRRTKIIQRN